MKTSSRTCIQYTLFNKYLQVKMIAGLFSFICSEGLWRKLYNILREERFLKSILGRARFPHLTEVILRPEFIHTQTRLLAIESHNTSHCSQLLIRGGKTHQINSHPAVLEMMPQNFKELLETFRLTI